MVSLNIIHIALWKYWSFLTKLGPAASRRNRTLSPGQRWSLLERAKWKLPSPIQLLISLHAAVKRKKTPQPKNRCQQRPGETSRRALYPSSTRIPDRRHWESYCSLGATRWLALVTQPSQSQALQTELLDMGPTPPHAPPRAAVELGTKKTTTEHWNHSVCTSNRDESDEFSLCTQGKTFHC